MADRVLFISWGEGIAGREERGLEVFNEAVGFYGRCKEEGRIEGFDVVVLTPNADIDGCMTLTGSADQLAALADDDEYLRILTEASLVVHKLRVTQGYTGTGVARMMGFLRRPLRRRRRWPDARWTVKAIGVRFLGEQHVRCTSPPRMRSSPRSSNRSAHGARSRRPR